MVGRRTPGILFLLAAVVVVQACNDNGTGTLLGLHVTPRATQDLPDDVSGLQIKIVYVSPADGPDRGLDTTGVLANSVGSFQTWFAGRTGYVLRQDTYQGRLDIAYLRSTKTDAQMAAGGASVVFDLDAQLRQAGFDEPSKRYLVYYDGTSTYACGGAIVDGRAAAMYLRAVLSSGARCSDGRFAASPTAPPQYWDFAMLHDSWHVAGCVGLNAPDHYAPNPYHVNNPADLMHGGPGAWDPSVVDPTGRNWFGDNVPAGVTNCKHDAILVPAPAATIASAGLQMRALRESPRASIPYHIHEVVEQLR